MIIYLKFANGIDETSKQCLLKAGTMIIIEKHPRLIT